MLSLKKISIILGEDHSLQERTRLVNHAEVFRPVLEELLEKSNKSNHAELFRPVLNELLEKSNKSNHAELFKPVLDELLEKSNQRIGIRHLMAQLNPMVNINENDYFSRWQKKLIHTDLVPQFSRHTPHTHYELAIRRLNILQEKFREDFDLLAVWTNFQNHWDLVVRCITESKTQCWRHLEYHPRFDDMLRGFARIIDNLNVDDFVFLGNFIGHDSHGVLIVVGKFIFMNFSLALASKLIIALYKPGAFFAFFIKAVRVIFPVGTSPYIDRQFAQLCEPNVHPIRFRPLQN